MSEVKIGKTTYKITDTRIWSDDKSGRTYTTHTIRKINKNGLSKKEKTLVQHNEETSWWLSGKWQGRPGVPKAVSPTFNDLLSVQ